MLRATSRLLSRTYSTATAASAADTAFKTPYAVSRTAGGALPVYSDIRNGRTNHLTVVRKVSGNVEALRADLAQYLADGHIDPLRPPPRVTVKPTSRHVEIKGRWVDEVKGWLAARGF